MQSSGPSTLLSMQGTLSTGIHCLYPLVGIYSFCSLMSKLVKFLQVEKEKDRMILKHFCLPGSPTFHTFTVQCSLLLTCCRIHDQQQGRKGLSFKESWEALVPFCSLALEECNKGTNDLDKSFCSLCWFSLR